MRSPPGSSGRFVFETERAPPFTRGPRSLCSIHPCPGSLTAGRYDSRGSGTAIRLLRQSLRVAYNSCLSRKLSYSRSGSRSRHRAGESSNIYIVLSQSFFHSPLHTFKKTVTKSPRSFLFVVPHPSGSLSVHKERPKKRERDKRRRRRERKQRDANRSKRDERFAECPPCFSSRDGKTLLLCVCVCLCVTAGKNLVLLDNVKLHYINIYLYIINRYHYSLSVKKLIYEKRVNRCAGRARNGDAPTPPLRRRRPRRHFTYKLRRAAVLRQFASLDRASRPLSRSLCIIFTK